MFEAEAANEYAQKLTAHSPLREAGVAVTEGITRAADMLSCLEQRLAPVLHPQGDPGDENTAQVRNLAISPHVAELHKDAARLSAMCKRIGALLERLDV